MLWTDGDDTGKYIMIPQAELMNGQEVTIVKLSVNIDIDHME